MRIVRVAALFAVLQLAPSLALAQSLDVLRVPGGGAAATDRWTWLWFLSLGPGANLTSAGTFTGDTSASATNSDSYDTGYSSAEQINDSWAQVNTATNATTSAASVNTANMVIAETTSSDDNEWVIAGNANVNPSTRGGVVANAVGVFQVQPDPTDPSITQAVISGTISVIGAVAENGLTGYVNEGVGRCGRYRVRLFDNLGNSTLDIFDGEIGEDNLLATYTGGSGGNYLLRTIEPVAVGGQFTLSANADTQGRAESFGSGASTVICSLSVLSSATASGVSGSPPAPSIDLDDEEEDD